MFPRLVYDQIIPVVDYTNLFIFGLTTALAWQLPDKPFYPSEVLMEKYENGGLPLLDRNDTVIVDNNVTPSSPPPPYSGPDRYYYNNNRNDPLSNEYNWGNNVKTNRNDDLLKQITSNSARPYKPWQYTYVFILFLKYFTV